MIVDLLISSGADVSKTSFGKTPLYWACSNNRVDIGLLLIAEGVDADVLRTMGSLDAAVRTELEQAVEDYNTMRTCIPIFK